MFNREKDPVCGMKIRVKDNTLRSVWQGKTYYFCASACKEKFDHSPDQYAAAKGCCGKHQHSNHQGHNHGHCH